MKLSKEPVQFANRALLADCTFSTAVHLPQRVVGVNLYAEAGTTVLEMTPAEAREFATLLLECADSAESGSSPEQRHVYQRLVKRLKGEPK